MALPLRPALSAAAAMIFGGLALPFPAAAQPPPSRIGNIWDGLAHQPTQGEVSAAEQDAGVKPGGAHEQQINNQLWDLDRQLLQSEGASTSSVPPNPSR